MLQYLGDILLKDTTPTLLISVVGVVFVWRQWKITREKLRHDLYDRRFAIYMAFHNLLIAAVEKKDFDDEFRKANSARAHAPFLLDQKLVALLEELQQEAFRIRATESLVQDQHAWSSQQEQIAQAGRIGPDKLRFSGRLQELIRAFGRFLLLKDFSSARKWFGS